MDKLEMVRILLTNKTDSGLTETMILLQLRRRLATFQDLKKEIWDTFIWGPRILELFTKYSDDQKILLRQVESKELPVTKFITKVNLMLADDGDLVKNLLELKVPHKFIAAYRHLTVLMYQIICDCNTEEEALVFVETADDFTGYD